jgi:hypothetical protein
VSGQYVSVATMTERCPCNSMNVLILYAVDNPCDSVLEGKGHRPPSLLIKCQRLGSSPCHSSCI